MPSNPRNQKAILPKLRLFLALNDADEDIRKSFEGGQCLGFSLCRAAMRKIGKLEWWNAALDEIVLWDGNPKLFDKQITLPQSNEPIPLSVLFQRIINYLSFNHASYPHLDFNQTNLLVPGGLFELIGQDGKTLCVNENYCIAGHFSELTLMEIFNEEATKKAFAEGLGLIHFFKHACEIGYQDGFWYFYNPSRQDGEAEVFLTIEEFVKKILSIASTRQQKNVALRLVALDAGVPKPFNYFNQLLAAEPEELLKENGFLSIAKYSSNLIPTLISSLQSQEKIHLIEPNQQNSLGKTALYFAARANNIEAIKVLCDLGADPKIGNNPLIIAIEGGCFKVIPYLCKKGANAEEALLFAIKHDYLKAFELLCQEELNFNKELEGKSLLLQIINYKRWDMLSYICQKEQVDPNQLKDGKTVLMTLVGQKNMEAVKQFCKMGANPIAGNPNNALHTAVFIGHVELLKILIKKTKTIPIKTYEELIKIASEKKFKDISRVLKQVCNVKVEKQENSQTSQSIFAVTSSKSQKKVSVTKKKITP